MKRLMLHTLASSFHRCLHCMNSCRNILITALDTDTYVCKSKDDEVCRLYYEKYGNINFWGKIAYANHRFIAFLRYFSVLLKC
jgi:hypothetical protein